MLENGAKNERVENSVSCGFAAGDVVLPVLASASAFADGTALVLVLMMALLLLLAVCSGSGAADPATTGGCDTSTLPASCWLEKIFS